MKLQKQSKNKKKLIIIFVAIFIIISGAIGGILLWRHDLSNQNHPTTKIQNGEKAISDPNVPGGTHKPGDDSQNNTTPGKEPSPSQPAIDPGKTPQTPSGTFVSNHHPHLSGQPTPNTETSTCTTTPGAYCKIAFINGSTIRELPSQQTDAYGNTHWEWSLQSIGLSEGSWKITATSINGNLTAVSSDSLELVVEQ